MELRSLTTESRYFPFGWARFMGAGYFVMGKISG